ncbi:unnamed protein product, partial [marine sediment metagenome]
RDGVWIDVYQGPGGPGGYYNPVWDTQSFASGRVDKVRIRLRHYSGTQWLRVFELQFFCVGVV